MSWIQKNALNKALKNNISMGILLVFIFSLIYLIKSWEDQRLLLASFMLLGTLLILFLVNKIPQFVMWLALLAFFTIDLAMRYFLKANHHFLLMYMIILIILFLKNGNREMFIANIKWLVVIILISAAIQKIVSSQFISGDFYYYMFNTGKFFKPLLYFSPDMMEITNSNNLQIEELEGTNPNRLKTLSFQNVTPHVRVISLIFAWLTVALELVVAMCLIWKQKHSTTHALFFILIIGIFITRLENGFLTLLVICGLWLSNSIRYRTIYTILAIGFMALIIGNIGFY